MSEERLIAVNGHNKFQFKHNFVLRIVFFSARVAQKTEVKKRITLRKNLDFVNTYIISYSTREEELINSANPKILDTTVNTSNNNT